MKNKMEDENKDWLSEFHEGQRLQRAVMRDIKGIANNLIYTFPHIAEDLKYACEQLVKSENLISSGLNRNMDEQLTQSQDFIGSALIGILNAYEKDQNE